MGVGGGLNVHLTTKPLSSTEVEMSGPKCSLPCAFMACRGTIYILPQAYKIYVTAMNILYMARAMLCSISRS